VWRHLQISAQPWHRGGGPEPHPVRGSHGAGSAVTVLPLQVANRQQRFGFNSRAKVKRAICIVWPRSFALLRRQNQKRGIDVMKRFITFACVAAALAAAPVATQAADVVRPAYRTAAGVVYNWTGFYGGAHVGFLDTGGDSGFLGGGQIGFNHQVGQWVFGVEGDISATSINDSASANFAVSDGRGNVIIGTAGARASLDWISTFAGRAGFAFDRWLVYGKLGAAWAHASGNGFVDMGGLGGGSVSVSNTVSGWVLGVGTEYALRDNWSVKVEYNRLEFDPGSINVVKAGVNYRFNFSDPFRY
jgi:outer membrane immunogenic protein